MSYMHYPVTEYAWLLGRALCNASLLPKVRSHPQAVKPSSQVSHLDIPFGLFIPLCSPILGVSEVGTWQEGMGSLSATLRSGRCQ